MNKPALGFLVLGLGSAAITSGIAIWPAIAMAAASFGAFWISIHPQLPPPEPPQLEDDNTAPEPQPVLTVSGPAPTDFTPVFRKMTDGKFTARVDADGSEAATQCNQAMEQLQTAIDEAVALADLMASGDLSTEANGQYPGDLKHLRESLNLVQAGLRSMISSASSTANNVISQSEEMREAASTILNRMEDQTEVLDTVSNAMSVLDRSVATIGERVEESKHTVESTVVTAQSAIEASNAAKDALTRLETDSKAIVGVLSVIEAIAQQTNLLAVNASIEAARAGAAGRGFAVVSDEVKALANRSSDAVNEIRGIVSRAEASTRECGVEVSRCVDTIEEFSGQMEGLHKISGGISDACDEQRASVAETKSGVKTLEDHSVMTKSLSRQADDISADLQKAAGLLKTDLNQFRLKEHTMVREVTERAALISQRLEEAIASGKISEEDLFSREYEAIEGFDPPQFKTTFSDITDALLPEILESAFDIHANVVFSAAVNFDGFLPTHNRKFSQLPRADDPVWNAANARNKRFFNDRVGLAAGQSTAPFLIQSYRRDMGGGNFVTMKDISAPILVNGRHWGGLRIGYKPEQRIHAVAESVEEAA